MEITFEKFFCELISDEIWHEFASKNHRPETFKKVAEQVYTLGLADREAFAIIPIREHRTHLTNKLNKIPPDKPKSKPWHEVEREKIEAKEKKEAEQIATYTKEHADKCAAEALEIIRNSKMVNSTPRIPHKQAVEEGGWIPKKDAPYPVTSVEEAYIKDRHLAYITYAYEPRTAVKMPGVMDEEQFNLEYDEMMLNKLGK